MVSFQTKNPNLGKFWRALDGKMLIYFRVIWNILRIFGIFYDHLVHFVFIWYIFPVLVSCTQENLATLGQTKIFGSIFSSFHAFKSFAFQLACYKQGSMLRLWRFWQIFGKNGDYFEKQCYDKKST
jgi:hypothetical protein